MAPAVTDPSVPADTRAVADLSLLAQLRTATHTSHAQIEQNPRLAQLFKPAFSRDLYRDLLARLLGFYEPLEGALRHLPLAEPEATLLALDERWKTPWLRQDLQTLGMDDASLRALPRAQARQLPPMTSLADAVGCLYVLEGATLGGQLISRHLASALAISPEHGGRFYAGYGAEGGRMWGRFRRALADLSLPDHRVPRVTSTAIHTFSCLDRWLVDEV